MTTTTIEEQMLDGARAFLLNTRMDQQTFSGPVFERGEGSVVYDVNGTEFLDFNPGHWNRAVTRTKPPWRLPNGLPVDTRSRVRT